MATKIETVCTRNQIAYKDVRAAMCDGARSREDLIEKAGICGECEGCQAHLDYVLTTLCGCKEVPMKTVQDLVAAGETSLEAIMEKTEAGTGEDCGKCQKLIENIIAQGY